MKAMKVVTRGEKVLAQRKRQNHHARLEEVMHT